MKRYSHYVIILFVFLLLSGLTIFPGCSSSGQAVHEKKESADDLENIDALLGLTSDETPAETPAGADREAIAEDDVLKLLGVTENSSSTSRVNDTAINNYKSETAATSNLNQQTVKVAERVEPEKKEIPVYKAPPADKPPFSRKKRPFQERYREALAKSSAREFRIAIQMFETLLSENMYHSLSDNCQYWIGECYDALGDYQQAAVAFEKVFTFKNSNKDPDAQLKLGICYLRLKDNNRARLELQKFIDNYPASKNVTLARQLIRSIK